MDVDTTQLQYPSTTVSPVLQAQVTPTSAPALVGGSVALTEDGDETDDEAEVVTPCENTHFDLSFGLQAETTKKALDGVGAGAVEVADVTMDEE